MNTSVVLVDYDDGLVTITINRPEARNAVNRAVSYGVCAAVDELDARDDLRVGILTGAGGTFCSGMDLKAFLRGEVIRVEDRGLMGIVFTPPRKPLIAAVEGYALAGGFEAMLACDLAVASRNAQFGIPEAKRGLAAAAGEQTRTHRTERLVAGRALRASARNHRSGSRIRRRTRGIRRVCRKAQARLEIPLIPVDMARPRRRDRCRARIWFSVPYERRQRGNRSA